MIQIYDHCQLCGRPLKDPTSMALGFGPKCHQKVLQCAKYTVKKLFIMKECKENIKD